MISLFKRKFSAAPADAAHGPSRRYVHTITLENVDEPFNAASLWERARPLLGDPYRLKSLLDQHTSSVGQEKHVFANVVVELPADEVEHDRRVASGSRGRHLAAELEQRHSSCFSQRLAGAATPRYAIRPGHDLAPGTARVRFGYGVYVPNETDQAAWKVEVSTDGVVDWSHVGDVQESQRLLILGGKAESASVVVPSWPFQDDQSIVLVNEPDNQDLDISAEPLRSLTVRRDENMGFHVIESNGQELRLYVRVTCLRPKVAPKTNGPKVSAVPLIVAPAKGASRQEPSLNEPCLDETPEAPETDETASGTFLPTLAATDEDEGTFLPAEARSHHRMTLVGIALQRVSSYREHGIEGLRFAFVAGGKIAPPVRGGRHLGFRVDEDDRTYAETGAGSRQVALGEKLPMPDGGHISLEALPQEMHEHYLAWCRLPTPISETIGEGARFTVGRGEHPVLSTLCLLSGKGFLVARKDAGADRMGLSRRHFLMEVTSEGLVITPIAKNFLTHLDENFSFVAQIDADTKPTSLVPPGHHIVVGHYVMRYDA